MQTPISVRASAMRATVFSEQNRNEKRTLRGPFFYNTVHIIIKSAVSIFDLSLMFIHSLIGQKVNIVCAVLFVAESVTVCAAVF